MVSSGHDSSDRVYPILVDSSGRPYVILDDGAGNTLPAGDAVGRPIFVKVTDGTETLQISAIGQALTTCASIFPDGANRMPSGDATNRPIFTTPGRQESFHVHLHKTGVGADTGLMLIDLSDTGNWPHTETAGIRILKVCMSIAASKLTDAKVSIGFLSSVDATDGDVNGILCWDVGFAGTNEPRDIDTCFDYSLFPYTVGATNWFGPKSLNNALFQTDVEIFGPDGGTTHASGDGDLVIFVDWTAGELDIACSIDYETFA